MKTLLGYPRLRGFPLDYTTSKENWLDLHPVFSQLPSDKDSRATGRTKQGFTVNYTTSKSNWLDLHQIPSKLPSVKRTRTRQGSLVNDSFPKTDWLDLN